LTSSRATKRISGRFFSWDVGTAYLPTQKSAVVGRMSA